MRFSLVIFLLSTFLPIAGQAKFSCVEEVLPKPAKAMSGAADGCSNIASASQALSSLAQLNLRRDNECVSYMASEHYDEKIKANLASEEDAADDWNQCIGSQQFDEKVNAIYKAANEYDMSPIVLAGAILQESSGGDLGLGRDFDNWTCGPSQFSVITWCEWASKQDVGTQKAINWPTALVKSFQSKNPDLNICSENKFLYREQSRPFLEIAMRRMKADIHVDKEYMLQEKYMIEPVPIQFKDVASELSTLSNNHHALLAGDVEAENIRFQITRSFTDNCANHNLAFRAMAFDLRKIFESLPPEIQKAQMMEKSKGKNLLYAKCKANITTKAYPLSVGWLIADAIYNAGPSILPGILDYQTKSKIPWDKFSQSDLLKAINHATTPEFGMQGIGPIEAKEHIKGLLQNVGAL